MLGPDGWNAIDIETDDDLLLRYAHRIPVLVIGGRERAELVITRPDLEEAWPMTDDPGDPPAASLQPALAVRHRPAGAVLAWLVSVPLLRGAPDGRAGTLVGQAAPRSMRPDLEGRDWSLVPTVESPG